MSESQTEALPQIIYDSNVCSKALPGRGNGLIASRALPANSYILFVERPLMLSLEIPRLADTCYYCLKGEDDDGNGSLEVAGSGSTSGLKSCTGCHGVKFCGKTCQTAAWQAYHKHECKLYSKLHPRILPSSVRAVIRLLKQRQAGLVSEAEWSALMDLESHQEDLSNAGGEKWQNIFLMIKAVKTYSGTKESMDTILKTCCILMMNSFTFTTPTFDPLGMIFHPLPALINHSCTPNAFVRFDVLSASTSSPSSPTVYGTITVQTLEPIPEDTELTISYIDTTSPCTMRQTELSSRYFFTCSCPLCLGVEDSITDHCQLTNMDSKSSHSSSITKVNNAQEIESKATLVLQSTQSKPGTEAQHIPSIESALASLSRSTSPDNTHSQISWPLHRYPSPQLRHQLILGYLTTKQFRKAMEQSLLISRKIDPLLFDQPHHPTRIVHLWRLFKLVRLCAFDDGGIDTNSELSGKGLNEEERNILSLYACALIQHLHDVSSSTSSSLSSTRLASSPRSSEVLPSQSTTESRTTNTASTMTPHKTLAQSTSRVISMTSKFSHMIRAAYTELRTNTPLWTTYISSQQAIEKSSIAESRAEIDTWVESVVERLLASEGQK